MLRVLLASALLAAGPVIDFESDLLEPLQINDFVGRIPLLPFVLSPKAKYYLLRAFQCHCELSSLTDPACVMLMTWAMGEYERAAMA